MKIAHTNVKNKLTSTIFASYLLFGQKDNVVIYNAITDFNKKTAGNDVSYKKLHVFTRKREFNGMGYVDPASSNILAARAVLSQSRYITSQCKCVNTTCRGDIIIWFGSC